MKTIEKVDIVATSYGIKKKDGTFKLEKIEVHPIPGYEEKMQELIGEFSVYERFQIVWMYRDKLWKIVKILYLLIRIRKALMKKDMKTTIGYIIKALILILGIFGINVSPEESTIIATAAGALYAAVGVVIGIFMKDKDKDDKE